ncbi:MBG domain-containing protein [Algoriphagus boritolerans]|uniref:MBG domain-containing protein n=1 Tax=Algoriphagus boritolerans TaxID=308111 RepID=UPI001356BB5D|nr:MBG domain-containing protein [Algoriphagus boritolerans]
MRIPLIVLSLLFSSFGLSAQSSFVGTKNQPVQQRRKGSLPGLEAAKVPSGLNFPSDLEKTYGDPDFELGQEFDLNGMLIKYSAEDTTILRITGNVAMILKAGETRVYAILDDYQSSPNSVPLTQNLKIKPRTLELTVTHGQGKIFGEEDPIITFEASGFAYDESVTIISGSLTRDLGENAGKYAINLGDLAVGDNYQIEFSGSDFEIIEREIFVEAQSAEKYYGVEDPELAFLVTGVNPEIVDHILTGQPERLEGEKVGKYAIEVGDLRVSENYKLTFRGAVFEILPVELTAVFDPEEISTPWSETPQLPAFIKALTLNGQILEFKVTWVQNELDVYKSGTYFFSGIIDLEEGISNPENLKPTQKLTILPKPSPVDVLLNRRTFDPVSSALDIEIGQFTVLDDFDDVHVVSLVEGRLDNSEFQLDGFTLYWKNTREKETRTNYSILVQVEDRAGNRLEKEFGLKTEINLIGKMRIYNVFTPNNDGYNDTWGIPSGSLSEEIQVQVFNKYGELLFEAKNSQEQWDGTYQGKNLPADTYFWLITSSESSEIRKGFLSLIR